MYCLDPLVCKLDQLKSSVWLHAGTLGNKFRCYFGSSGKLTSWQEMTRRISNLSQPPHSSNISNANHAAQPSFIFAQHLPCMSESMLPWLETTLWTRLGLSLPQPEERHFDISVIRFSVSGINQRWALPDRTEPHTLLLRKLHVSGGESRRCIL